MVAKSMSLDEYSRELQQSSPISLEVEIGEHARDQEYLDQLERGRQQLTAEKEAEIRALEAEVEGLEATVRRGLAAYVEAGQALAKIRDKLFKPNGQPRLILTDGEGGYFKSWSDYLARRWKFTRQNAHLLIQEASIAKHVEAPEDASRKSLRPLFTVPAEAQKEAYTRAKSAAGGTPTEAQVRDAVSTLHFPARGRSERPTVGRSRGRFEYLMARLKREGAHLPRHDLAMRFFRAGFGVLFGNRERVAALETAATSLPQ